MSTLEVKMRIKYEPSTDFENYQELKIDECGGYKMSACNLDECPEDAIIGRSLIDCYDIIDAMNFGIKLAKAGYDKVEVNETDVSD